MLAELSLDALPFAVVDMDTTGCSPRLHDRIIEIAIVRASRNGDIDDECVTLVNPRPTSARPISMTSRQPTSSFDHGFVSRGGNGSGLGTWISERGTRRPGG